MKARIRAFGVGFAAALLAGGASLAACDDDSSGALPEPSLDGSVTFDGGGGQDATVLDSAVPDAAREDATACVKRNALSYFDGGPLLNPTPYLQKSDSPFHCDAFTYFYVGDFEGDGGLPRGASAGSGALAVPPGTFEPLIDSVDEDDGVVDGGRPDASYPCERCNTWFNGSGPTGVDFSFDEVALGGLPTRVGLVWTDGTGPLAVTFSAYGADGGLIAEQTVDGIGDGSNYGTTAEDRFFGVVFDGGVKRVKMTDNSGGIEVDHLQYGR